VKKTSGVFELKIFATKRNKCARIRIVRRRFFLSIKNGNFPFWGQDCFFSLLDGFLSLGTRNLTGTPNPHTPHKKHSTTQHYKTQNVCNKKFNFPVLLFQTSKKICFLILSFLSFFLGQDVVEISIFQVSLSWKFRVNCVSQHLKIRRSSRKGYGRLAIPIVGDERRGLISWSKSGGGRIPYIYLCHDRKAVECSMMKQTKQFRLFKGGKHLRAPLHRPSTPPPFPPPPLPHLCAPLLPHSLS
jgi:hypothetical protein